MLCCAFDVAYVVGDVIGFPILSMLLTFGIRKSGKYVRKSEVAKFYFGAIPRAGRIDFIERSCTFTIDHLITLIFGP